VDARQVFVGTDDTTGFASFSFSTALPTIAAAILRFLKTSDCCPLYSPELNPKEKVWDEIREKIFKNDALKSMDAVHAKLDEAILYVERSPKLIRSIDSFPRIVN
jgi:hypothetical protein